MVLAQINHFTIGDLGKPVLDCYTEDENWYTALEPGDYYLTREAAEAALKQEVSKRGLLMRIGTVKRVKDSDAPLAPFWIKKDGNKYTPHSSFIHCIFGVASPGLMGVYSEKRLQELYSMSSKKRSNRRADEKNVQP